LAPKIWAQNPHQLDAFKRENDTIAVWEPEWPDLYDEGALKSAIARTYESAYRSRFGQIDGAIEFRDETLQRSQLLPTRGRVATASVLKAHTQELVVYHRCYLYPTKSADGKEWNVIVRRYPSGGEQASYTQYLASRCQDSTFLSELVALARPIW